MVDPSVRRAWPRANVTRMCFGLQAVCLRSITSGCLCVCSLPRARPPTFVFRHPSFPPADHDDGSSYYNDHNNFEVYGGHKSGASL